MSSRERRRAERRKRKQRGREGTGATTAGAGGGEPEAPGQGDGDGSEAEDIASIAAARGVSRSQARDQLARERLDPLEPGQRPRVVTIGAVISALIALFTVGAWVVGAEVNGERPNVVQVFAPAILFAVMAWGMWNARYWAVLGFQAVMAILMVGAFLTLISATSVLGGVTPIVIGGGAGIMFWYTVKALARIQMPDRNLPR